MSGDHLRSLRIHGELHSQAHSPYIRHSVRAALLTIIHTRSQVQAIIQSHSRAYTSRRKIRPFVIWTQCYFCCILAGLNHYILVFYFPVEEKFAGGKFREIPFAVDIIFAGGKFRAKLMFRTLLFSFFLLYKPLKPMRSMCLRRSFVEGCSQIRVILQNSRSHVYVHGLYICIARPQFRGLATTQPSRKVCT